jgi:hypothetical protein
MPRGFFGKEQKLENEEGVIYEGDEMPLPQQNIQPAPIRMQQQFRQTPFYCDTGKHKLRNIVVQKKHYKQEVIIYCENCTYCKRII